MEFVTNIGIKAQRAMAYEVLQSPKPGLVDKRNNGGNKDMDLFTLIDSCIILGPYFKECAKVGVTHELKDILKTIRPLGVQAEKDICQVTSGVNAHEELIFIMGVLCAGAGHIVSSGKDIDGITLSKISEQIVMPVLEGLDTVDEISISNGMEQFVKSNLTSDNEEKPGDFFDLLKGYDIFLGTLKRTSSESVAIGQTLLYFMSEIFDNSIVNSSGVESLELVKSMAARATELGGYESGDGIDYIYEMDRVFIFNNISPVGSSNLASCVYFIHLLTTL